MKLWVEILQDKKMAGLSDRLWRRFVELILVAKAEDEDGKLPDLWWCGRQLGLSEEELEADLVELAKTGLVANDEGRWVIPKYTERQAAKGGSDLKRIARGWRGGRDDVASMSGSRRVARAEVEEESEEESEKKPRRRKAPSTPRAPDLLFDAIAEVCKIDPATAGPSVGKVKKSLASAKPAYTPEEVRLFGVWWWGKADMRKRPPTLWQLQEQIGVVRTAEVKKLIRKDPGALPESTEVWIPPYQRVEAK